MGPGSHNAFLLRSCAAVLRFCAHRLLLCYLRVLPHLPRLGRRFHTTVPACHVLPAYYYLPTIRATSLQYCCVRSRCTFSHTHCTTTAATPSACYTTAPAYRRSAHHVFYYHTCTHVYSISPFSHYGSSAFILQFCYSPSDLCPHTCILPLVWGSTTLFLPRVTYDSTPTWSGTGTLFCVPPCHPATLCHTCFLPFYLYHTHYYTYPATHVHTHSSFLQSTYLSVHYHHHLLPPLGPHTPTDTIRRFYLHQFYYCYCSPPTYLLVVYYYHHHTIFPSAPATCTTLRMLPGSLVLGLGSAFAHATAAPSTRSSRGLPCTHPAAALPLHLPGVSLLFLLFCTARTTTVALPACTATTLHSFWFTACLPAFCLPHHACWFSSRLPATYHHHPCSHLLLAGRSVPCIAFSCSVPTPSFISCGFWIPIPPAFLVPLQFTPTPLPLPAYLLTCCLCTVPAHLYTTMPFCFLLPPACLLRSPSPSPTHRCPTHYISSVLPATFPFPVRRHQFLCLPHVHTAPACSFFVFHLPPPRYGSAALLHLHTTHLRSCTPRLHTAFLCITHLVPACFTCTPPPLCLLVLLTCCVSLTCLGLLVLLLPLPAILPPLLHTRLPEFRAHFIPAFSPPAALPACTPFSAHRLPACHATHLHSFTMHLCTRVGSGTPHHTCLPVLPHLRTCLSLCTTSSVTTFCYCPTHYATTGSGPTFETVSFCHCCQYHLAVLHTCLPRSFYSSARAVACRSLSFSPRTSSRVCLLPPCLPQRTFWLRITFPRHHAGMPFLEGRKMAGWIFSRSSATMLRARTYLRTPARHASAAVGSALPGAAQFCSLLLRAAFAPLVLPVPRFRFFCATIPCTCAGFIRLFLPPAVFWTCAFTPRRGCRARHCTAHATRRARACWFCTHRAFSSQFFVPCYITFYSTPRCTCARTCYCWFTLVICRRARTPYQHSYTIHGYCSSASLCTALHHAACMACIPILLPLVPFRATCHHATAMTHY